MSLGTPGKQAYHATAKGKDLIPLLLEMMVWSAAHDPGVAVPEALLAELTRDRAAAARAVRDLSGVEAFLATLPPAGRQHDFSYLSRSTDRRPVGAGIQPRDDAGEAHGPVRSLHVRHVRLNSPYLSVGLDKRLRDRPSQLSGGQQQRVAIARALITRPEVVFADEPTGALDIHTGHEVLALLRDVVDEDGRTVVMVTHDPVAAAYADRVMLLADGQVAGTLDAPSADEVAKRLAHLGA